MAQRENEIFQLNTKQPDIETAAKSAVESKDPSKEPYVSKTAESADNNIRSILTRENIKDEALRQHYLNIAAKYKAKVMGLQIEPNDDPHNVDYIAWERLKEQESELNRRVRMEHWRQQVVEQTLQPVAKYALTATREETPTEESKKRQVVAMMFMDAVTSRDGQVDVHEFITKAEEIIDLFKPEELLAIVRTVNRAARYRGDNFATYVNKPPESDLAREERRKAVAELDILINEQTPEKKEKTNDGWEYVHKKSGEKETNRYANHAEKVKSAQATGEVKEPLDTRTREDLKEKGAFGRSKEAPARSEITARKGYVVNPDNNQVVEVEVLAVTFKTAMRQIEKTPGYTPDMLKAAVFDKTQMAIIDRTIASGTYNSPEMLVALAEQLESAQKGKDGSYRIPLNPPPNWLIMSEQEYIKLESGYKSTKESFKRARIDIEKYRDLAVPEMAMVAENKIDKGELALSERAMLKNYDREISASEAAGNTFLAQQLREARDNIREQYNYVIDNAGLEARYLDLAQERLLKRGILNRANLGNEAYWAAVREEAEKIKLEMLYRLLALKVAEKNLTAKGRNKKLQLEYLMNLDYETQKWTIARMLAEEDEEADINKLEDKLDKAFQKLERKNDAPKNTQQEIDDAKRKLKATNEEAEEKFTNLPNIARAQVEKEYAKALRAARAGEKEIKHTEVAEDDPTAAAHSIQAEREAAEAHHKQDLEAITQFEATKRRIETEVTFAQNAEARLTPDQQAEIERINEEIQNFRNGDGLTQQELDRIRNNNLVKARADLIKRVNDLQKKLDAANQSITVRPFGDRVDINALRAVTEVF